MAGEQSSADASVVPDAVSAEPAVVASAVAADLTVTNPRRRAAGGCARQVTAGPQAGS